MATPSEDAPETTTSSEDLCDMIQQLQQDDPKRDIVVVVAGKSGAGKSTLINNFLALDPSRAAKADFQPTSVTETAQRYDEEVNGILVRAIDMPGLHALDSKKEEAVIADLIHVTGNKADVMIYCVKLNDRLDETDKKNIGTLTTAFGKKIWNNAIFVLTHADLILEDGKTDLDELITKFSKTLEEMLAKHEVETYIEPFLSHEALESRVPTAEMEIVPNSNAEDGESARDPANAPGTKSTAHGQESPVANVGAEHEDNEDPVNAASESTAEDLPVTIVAIPTGREPNKPRGWRDALLAQLITIYKIKANSKLTDLEGEIKMKLKKGAKVGAIAGTVGSISGAAVGTGIGAGIGALVGGVLTAPIGGVGAIPTAAGGAALGAVIGSVSGFGGIGALSLLSGGIGSAYKNKLFKDIAFYRKVQKKLKELQKKEANESQSSA